MIHVIDSSSSLEPQKCVGTGNFKQCTHLRSCFSRKLHLLSSADILTAVVVTSVRFPVVTRFQDQKIAVLDGFVFFRVSSFPSKLIHTSLRLDAVINGNSCSLKGLSSGDFEQQSSFLVPMT